MITLQAVMLSGETYAQAIQGADSMNSLVEGLRAAEVYDTTDSIVEFTTPQHSLSDLTAVMPGDTMQVGADQIFGPLSELLSPAHYANSSIADTFISDNAVFKLLILLCFGIYCVSFYLYRGQAFTVLNIFRSKLYVDNLLGEHNYTFDTFLNIAISQAVIGVSLVAIKTIDIFYCQQVSAAMPQWSVSLMALGAIAVFGIVILYQFLALVSAGTLTGNQKFISKLRYLRKINFALFSLIFTPLLLMVAMAPAISIVPLVIVLGLGVSVIAIFHLISTYLMFVDENISKLYWFLYLCAVEIFPFSFLVSFFRKFFM